jgi:hypothetical protein
LRHSKAINPGSPQLTGRAVRLVTQKDPSFDW